MQGASKRVVAWAVLACTGAAGVAPAPAALSLTFSSTPNPVIVVEGNPGAIKWTVTNTSTTSTGENLNIVIDTVEMSAAFPMDFVGGDREDEAYNPEIVNAGQYASLVLLPGATFSFTEVFQSRDLGNTVEPDEGLWDTRVRLEYHAAANPTAMLNALSPTSRIRVQDPNFPEPGASAMFALTGGLALRRVRKPA